jgi:hypothetical protein
MSCSSLSRRSLRGSSPLLRARALACPGGGPMGSETTGSQHHSQQHCESHCLYGRYSLLYQLKLKGLVSTIPALSSSCMLILREVQRLITSLSRTGPKWVLTYFHRSSGLLRINLDVQVVMIGDATFHLLVLNGPGRFPGPLRPLYIFHEFGYDLDTVLWISKFQGLEGTVGRRCWVRTILHTECNERLNSARDVGGTFRLCGAATDSLAMYLKYSREA